MVDRTISATEARVHFGELLDSVTQKGEVVYVQRGGVPQVAVVPIQMWKQHQRQEDPWTAAARRMEAYWEYLKEERKAGRIKDIDELERQSREERDERILGNLPGQ